MRAMERARDAVAAPARLEAVDAAMRRHHHRGDALLEVLHVAQAVNGFLSEEVLLHVARGLHLPPSRVYGVATFYNLFRLRPRGAHVCTVCLGTACWVDGAGALLAAAEEASGVAPGETSADGRVSLELVRCIGACGGAPVVAYDGRLAGHERADAVRAALAAWGPP
jgi:bidirectional [NiFe] hydrogenase diaphorase subunit